MRFSTRTTYGLRALVYLVRQSEANKVVPLKQIAEAENISVSYLERLFARLKRVGVLTAVKGAAGGYCLARPADEISILKIVDALEGGVAVFHCVGDSMAKACPSRHRCGAASVLDKVQASLSLTLDEIRLGDLKTNKI